MAVAPYGSWRSPITAELIVAGSVSLGGPVFAGGDLWWSELRPAERGRVQLVRKPLDGPPDSARDVLPEGYSARTRVHEYGGGAWWVGGLPSGGERAGATVFFANWDDQRLHRLDPGGEPVALTPEAEIHHGLRYADGRLTPDGRWIVCVRERHARAAGSEARNQLVALRSDGSGVVTVLVDGPDFVSSPRLSPDGTELRWIQWDHPNMPWDHTLVGRGTLAERDGCLVLDDREVTDRGPVSLVQPAYAPAYAPGGERYVVADLSGAWRIHRDGPGFACVGRPDDGFEWAPPPWVFGQSSYAFTTDGRGIVAACRRGGRDHLVWVPAAGGPGEWGEPVTLEVPFTSIEGVQAGPGGVVGFVGASFTAEPQVVTVGTARAGEGDVAVTVHRPARDLGIGPEWLSAPEHRSFERCFGFYYPPTNPEFEGPESSRPPLIVVGHGGPTGAARPQLNLGTQFWTSRGFGVVDVNYRGSTGYGRRFRELLNGQWGVVDVEDCIAAARELVGAGLVDGDRLVIRGGSAGGYTVLRALTTSEVFAAGASLYGIADLEALTRDTHKFESRYNDGLVGPYPGARHVYIQRSPIHHLDRLRTPLIILQGLEDEIVPPAQAEMMVDALRTRRVPFAYLTFAGEQHGFRQAASIRRAIEAELYFYGRVLGFEPADEVEPVPIELL